MPTLPAGAIEDKPVTSFPFTFQAIVNEDNVLGANLFLESSVQRKLRYVLSDAAKSVAGESYRPDWTTYHYTIHDCIEVGTIPRWRCFGRRRVRNPHRHVCATVTLESRQRVAVFRKKITPATEKLVVARR